MPDVVPPVVQENDETCQSQEDNKSQSDSDYSDDEDKDSLFLFGHSNMEEAAKEETSSDKQFDLDFEEFVPQQ
jgi:hypothetical protein